MSKDENSGLLSKVVRFVKNPTVNWSELDHSEETRDSHYSKQALKEMIERKRRNDFVRRREFDQLRKLRRREVVAGAGDPQGRPSFFQSSLASRPDDRAVTLKKIDEIEAQMSMQWWRNKQSGATTLPPTAPNDVANPVSSFTVSDAQAAEAYTEPPAAPSPETLARAFAPTQDGVLTDLDARQLLDTPAPAQPRHRPQFAATTVEMPLPGRQADSGFSPSRLLGAETPVFAHPPEMEEAAIRFANGDAQGAEAALLGLLAGPMGAQQEAWVVLFDLYRATGWQDRFDSAAIDFAARFGRSAPLWSDLSHDENAGSAASPASSAAMAPEVSGFNWICPDQLGIQALAVLRTSLLKAPSPWQIDWTRLVNIEAPAVAPLADLLEQWASSKCCLRILGAEIIDEVLCSRTVSGDTSVSVDWWRLRMAYLHLMGQAEQFELVALDYCVTYEVSPPSWSTPLCDCVALTNDGLPIVEFAMTVPADSLRAPSGFLLGSEFPTTQADLSLNENLLAPAQAHFELVGEVSGDLSEPLPPPEPDAPALPVLVVACDRLVRLDFSAAGAVLNWAAARQAEGSQVQFHGLHRLVAIFFNVIGINEHARVLLRRD